MKYLIILLILFNILIASRWIIDGNLFFHTDIARDFLLLEDVVDNRHLALIGPRSGAIPGLFHGPLWLYLNLPAYLIGNGDPTVVGWFWVILYISSLLVIYFTGKKLFGEKEGQLAAVLLSSVTILGVRSLFNPYGALILSPLFLFFFINYLRNQKLRNLILSFLTLGFIIQFQMAFGVPVLILTISYLAYFIFKKKKLSHLVSLLILPIPLITFLLFDLRNNFLQIKSVINYVFGSQTFGKLGLSISQLISLRIKELVVDGLGIISQGNIYLISSLFVFFLLSLFIGFKNKSRNLDVHLLIIYFYLGFWLFTIFFKGPVWNYYFLPFIPFLIILFVGLKRELNKVFFYVLFIGLVIVNMSAGIKDMSTYNSNVSEQDVSTWKFNKLVAEKVFERGESEFGYFIFTPDLYGYSPRFALNYYQKRNKEKRIFPYQKKAVTYLVIAPPPVYGQDPNSIWYQKNTNSKLWKANDIRITKEPASIITFENGFVVEKYYLSDEEIKVEPNPYLIKDIFFR
ncbi:MAG: glycosyltransferase family 39 protein [Candidatus Daviesbacteria bacterium]|nr:glycosyltransferase family 39 protein [Candidatus Daviesbacteria bacterium]